MSTVTTCKWHNTICGKSQWHDQKVLEILNKCSKLVGYKINLQKYIAFFTLITNYKKEKLREKSITIALKNNKKPRNKSNQRGKSLTLCKL